MSVNRFFLIFNLVMTKIGVDSVAERRKARPDAMKA